MTEINMLLAALTLIGSLLVLRAFIFHINFRNRKAEDNLAIFGLIVVVTYTLRTAYWDIIFPFSGREPSDGLVNFCFSCMMLIGQYFALSARLLLIPEKVRGNYNLITGVFYPEHFWRWK